MKKNYYNYYEPFSTIITSRSQDEVEDLIFGKNLVFNKFVWNKSDLLVSATLVSNDIFSIGNEQIFSAQTNFVIFTSDEMNNDYSGEDNLIRTIKLGAVLCASENCAILITDDLEQAAMAYTMHVPFILNRQITTKKLIREIKRYQNQNKI
ncbi:MAG: hypothetical protein AABY10_02425 [Nanoarchaeota archaeon]